jgi:purine-cytosine permease-like protein
MADEPEAQEVNEYEREPVPESARLGLKSFVGQYAGEHVAGTELMIGPLFIVNGVSAAAVVGGLFAGNLLAVLSWMLLCAPIATRARMTLYFQLEKICGRRLVILYNLANGIMFCFLAGSMVTVAATALGVFGIRMPGLGDNFPNSPGWIIGCLAIGATIAVVAACGYRMVSRVANYSAPWMVLVFLAFGIISLKQFIGATNTDVRSLGDVWDLCSTSIWRGGEPMPGAPKFTFWHIMFFAWFCNMAMHIGMADLSVFRYAKKSWYSIASAAGMYVGHFMAWLSASMLYAFQLHHARLSQEQIDRLAAAGKYTKEFLLSAPLTSELIRDAMALKVMDSPPAPLPGPLAYGACGIAGIICVILASWTTANPTIYRAGLAFQAIMPKASRFRVTLATGMLAAAIGLFPAVAMKLLGFVALYGLVLMPMGAVVFVDFWLMKRFGMQPFYAEASGTSFNWAAALTWFLTLAGCVALALSGTLEIFFVSLPGWFVAAVLYPVLSKLIQKKPAAAGTN